MRNAASSQSSSAPGSGTSKEDQHSLSNDRQSAKQGPRDLGSERQEGVTHIQPESEEGNVEYKLRLKEPTPQRFHQLVSPLLLGRSS
jgi:hypothetical protein